LIRPATLADVFAVVTVEHRCATAAHWTELQYRQALQGEGPERLFVVAEDSLLIPATESGDGPSSGVVGFLIARHLAPEWELENIVVAHIARRKGLGKLLLNALLSAARETNSDSVFLEVRESNAAARTLYEKAGFEQTGRRKTYYTNPTEDAVLYRGTLR
jgi:[ribosomal protein S18]-alanine N-acetyltransferase